jgi:hypothetical protein
MYFSTVRSAKGKMKSLERRNRVFDRENGKQNKHGAECFNHGLRGYTRMGTQTENALIEDEKENEKEEDLRWQ